MRAFNLIWAGALSALALCLAGPAGAQVGQTQAQVIATCGSISGLPLGDFHALYMTPDGRLCINTGGTSGSQPVDTVVQGVAVYRGGTITTGGTSQQLMAANPARRGFSVQNQSTTDLYIKVGQTATTSNVSLRLSPGQFYETQPQHVSPSMVHIIGATTGQAFYATEF